MLLNFKNLSEKMEAKVSVRELYTPASLNLA